jgi:hypothetical protein
MRTPNVCIVQERVGFGRRNKMNIDKLKENITALTLPEFEELVNFVFRQGQERNAGIKQFNERINWTVEPRHEETVH